MLSVNVVRFLSLRRPSPFSHGFIHGERVLGLRYTYRLAIDLLHECAIAA